MYVYIKYSINFILAFKYMKAVSFDWGGGPFETAQISYRKMHIDKGIDVSVYICIYLTNKI
jgi:hypothetical protein